MTKGPTPSLAVTLNDGSKQAFPTLDDYVAWYVDEGHIIDKSDLIENKSHLISEIFYDWIRRSKQIGCHFAEILANKAASTSSAEKNSSGLESHVFPRALENPDLISDINGTLTRASRSFEGVILIFPGIETQQDLIRLINHVCGDKSWYWTQITWNQENEKSGLVGLRWILPDGKSVNLVLGFAPLSSMPLTRRAPFTALILRVQKEKRSPKPWVLEDDRMQVHLADLDSQIESARIHEQIWELTKKYRKNIVEAELTSAARARITFSFPLELMEHLCQPENPEIREV